MESEHCEETQNEGGDFCTSARIRGGTSITEGLGKRGGEMGGVYRGILGGVWLHLSKNGRELRNLNHLGGNPPRSINFLRARYNRERWRHTVWFLV